MECTGETLDESNRVYDAFANFKAGIDKKLEMDKIVEEKNFIEKVDDSNAENELTEQPEAAEAKDALEKPKEVNSDITKLEEDDAQEKETALQHSVRAFLESPPTNFSNLAYSKHLSARFTGSPVAPNKTASLFNNSLSRYQQPLRATISKPHVYPSPGYLRAPMPAGCYSAGNMGGGDAPYLGYVRAQQNPHNTLQHDSFGMHSLQRGFNAMSLSPLPNGYTAYTDYSSTIPPSLRRNQMPQVNLTPQLSSVLPSTSPTGEPTRFSRKVFVGGLPPDIQESSIASQFQCFGSLVVDWPHKTHAYKYPPKGFCFLIFLQEDSVCALINSCAMEEDKLYFCVSSSTIRNKPVQVRPWAKTDAVYSKDNCESLDPRKTVFVGGIPRTLKAIELAMLLEQMYGTVCYVSIDTDTELHYPKGSGRVTFLNEQSYIAAVAARYVAVAMSDAEKRIEIKPYVLNDQPCDQCHGQRCSGSPANCFCSNVDCLKYYCNKCWSTVHARAGYEYHQPLVKETSERRSAPGTARWRNLTATPQV